MGKRGRGSKPNHVKLVAQGKGRIKRTQQTPFDPAGSDDIVYSVREIKAERVAKGNAQWLVGWENFPDAKHDTWEPVENLAGLETLISEFRQQFKEEQELLEAQTAEKKKSKELEKGLLASSFVVPSSKSVRVFR